MSHGLGILWDFEHHLKDLVSVGDDESINISWVM